MSNRILLVEDDQSFGAVLKDYLMINNFEVTLAIDGELGLKEFTEKEFDICIFDVMMPKKDGFSLAEDVRKIDKNTPIIFLTARNQREDVLKGYQIGADDYITKPFEIQEVLARIQVQLRHMQQEPEHKSVSYKNLELDRERFEVRIAGVLLPKITKQEFAILELLLEHPKQVFSKEEIFEYAWDEHYMGETKTLDVHISNIRKKIKAVTQEEYIDTVWGIGYRLHS